MMLVNGDSNGHDDRMVGSDDSMDGDDDDNSVGSGNYDGGEWC